MPFSVDGLTSVGAKIHQTPAATDMLEKGTLDGWTCVMLASRVHGAREQEQKTRRNYVTRNSDWEHCCCIDKTRRGGFSSSSEQRERRTILVHAEIYCKRQRRVGDDDWCGVRVLATVCSSILLRAERPLWLRILPVAPQVHALFRLCPAHHECIVGGETETCYFAAFLLGGKSENASHCLKLGTHQSLSCRILHVKSMQILVRAFSSWEHFDFSTNCKLRERISKIAPGAELLDNDHFFTQQQRRSRDSKGGQIQAFQSATDWRGSASPSYR